MRKLPETITEDEFIQIMKKTKKPHHKLAFALGFYQGLRISEIVNLKPEHINRGQQMIMVKAGKGNKDRNIPIAKEIIRQINGIPIKCGVRALEIVFKLKVKAILGRNLHFHNLRHSSATHYLNKKKWNIRQVQQFLGHSRLDTTQIYTIVSPEDLKNAMWG